MSNKIKALSIFCVATFFWSSVSFAERVLSVAVAADFASALDQLGQAFSKTHPVVLKTSVGPSGNLYQQIAQGAPYDLFFSADRSYVDKLIAHHLAQKEYTKIYAEGILVLWSRDSVLRCNDIAKNFSTINGKIVLANPDIAPYGKAGREALIGLNLYQSLQSRLVFANDIGQAAYFLESGAASMAFVSKAGVVAYQKTSGSNEIQNNCVVPQNLYSPLFQKVALLPQGKNTILAKEFFAFLSTPAAQKIIAAAGYENVKK